ncbi:MAG: hypothetical protein AAFY41_10565, partial [Bacteroidota bacterium]
MERYNEYTANGTNTHKFADDTKKSLDKIFKKFDDLTQEVHDNVDALIAKAGEFVTIYNRLENNDPEICDSIDPFDRLFASTNGISPEDIDKFSAGYEAIRKLEIISDYTLNHLSTVYAASKVDLTLFDYVDELDNIGQIIDENEDPVGILLASQVGNAVSSLALGWRINSSVSKYLGSVSEVQALIANSDVITNNLKSASQASQSADDAVVAAKLAWDQARNYVKSLRGNPAATTSQILKAMDDAVDARALFLTKQKEAKAAKDALTKAAQASKNAKNALVAKKLGNAPSVYANAAKSGKNLSRAKAILKTGGPLALLTAVSIVGDFLLENEHKITSQQLYDKLRDEYAVDLARIAALSDENNRLEDYIGYKGSENTTFSAGGSTEMTFVEEDMVKNTILGTYGSGYSIEMEFGVGAQFAAILGFIAATEVGNIKFKLSATIDVDQNVTQKISSSEQSKTTKKVGYVLSDDDDGDIFNTYIVHTLTGFDKLVSPYFHVIGGKSSDPYEEGTIPRDLPTISLEDEEGNKYSSLFFNQDPDLP